jgi:hypothetical protein
VPMTEPRLDSLSPLVDPQDPGDSN